MRKRIAVIWENPNIGGSFEVVNGKLLSEPLLNLDNNRRYEIEIEGNDKIITSGSTRITVNGDVNSFTFNILDVTSQYPIYIPEYGAAVIPADDIRTYDEIDLSVKALGLQKQLGVIEDEPEASYEDAAEHTRNLKCATWLGLSRDVRIFWVGFRGDKTSSFLPMWSARSWEFVTPKYHAVGVKVPELIEEITYSFSCGRGMGCEENVHRSLEEGWMPILKSEISDDSIHYEISTFASPECSDFTLDTLRGTEFIVADAHTLGTVPLNEEQGKIFDSLKEIELEGDEQTVLYYRTCATNTGKCPDYAHFRVPMPFNDLNPNILDENNKRIYEFSNGLGFFPSGRVYCIAKINDKTLYEEEFSVMLLPGEKVIIDYIIPHSPLPENRAKKLAEISYEQRLNECKFFWKSRIDEGATITLPEKRIDEMVKAGLCHVNVAAYGKEPDGPVIATVGVYGAIGSESAPHILFMDSMGYHDIARRMLQYFFEKQRKDGFIQNYGGYEIETGPVLWCAGEHYRFTRDKEWVSKIADNLIRGSEYILSWRNRNKTEGYMGSGYGLIDGRVSDPLEKMHNFMLNGYSYLGIARVAEMLDEIGHPEARRFVLEAEDYKKDIVNAFSDSIRKSPVVPLDDGSWCPTCAPWTEGIGPVFFHFEGGNWLTHTCLCIRDSINGPLYLAFTEVLDCKETAVGFLMDYHAKYMTQRNVGFGQPYYSRHDYIHIMRSEVKAFLKDYYNSFSGLADRETYDFWEHYIYCSPHKTHEECWFLMQTRWMLYLEEGRDLKIFPGIPRSWLKGNGISIKGVASYFGHLDISAKMSGNGSYIYAEILCEQGRLPQSIYLRLPHPSGAKAVSCEGGEYCSKTETVKIRSFDGRSSVVLKY